MTGKTHQLGGELSALLGFIVLKEKGYLLEDVNPYLQLIAMYPFALWGSKALDLDHHKDSIPMRDLFSVCVHNVLHITGKPYKVMKTKLESSDVSSKKKKQIRKSLWFKLCRMLNASHRSWQTHSDLTLIFLIGVFWLVFSSFLINTSDMVLLSVISIGVLLGMVSHLILDALTTDGIHLLIFRFINLTVLGNSKVTLPEKLHLVPASKKFSCESDWEKLVRVLLRILSVVSLIYLIIIVEDPELPYKVIMWFYKILQ